MMDALALSRAIKSKQASCVEVMNATLDHIERLNPHVNAIVSLQDRGALIKQSQERDAQLARDEYCGWMHGFPLAVKDLIATKGIRTTQGSPIFKDFVPTADAIVVDRMKRAGGIVIGKTNTPEFGLGSNTYNDVFGRTLNAYDQIEDVGWHRAAAPASQWRCACCRLPTAAIMAARCATRRHGTTCSASALVRPRPGAGPRRVLRLHGRAGSDGAQRAGPRHAAFGASGLRPAFAAVEPPGPGAIRERPAARSQGRAYRLVRRFRRRHPVRAGRARSLQSALKTFEALGCIVEEATPDFPIEKVWQNWRTLRAWQTGVALKDLYSDPAKRALMKPEAVFEVESGQKLSGFEIYDASAVRTAGIRPCAPSSRNMTTSCFLPARYFRSTRRSIGRKTSTAGPWTPIIAGWR